jgi:hypothetical protein
MICRFCDGPTTSHSSWLATCRKCNIDYWNSTKDGKIDVITYYKPPFHLELMPESLVVEIYLSKADDYTRIWEGIIKPDYNLQDIEVIINRFLQIKAFL